MELCTKLSDKVLNLETTTTAQAKEIANLKKRVKKLEKKKKSRTHEHKRLYKVGLSARIVFLYDEASLGNQEVISKQGRKIHDINADEDITLENVHDEDMFGVNDLKGNEIVVESEVAYKDVNLSVDEVTLAQALAALKSVKVQEKGDAIKEPSVPVSVASTKDMDMISMEVIRRYHRNDTEINMESSDIAISTATYVRYRTKEQLDRIGIISVVHNYFMAIILGFIEDVTKTIDYYLFDVVVEFHRCVLLSYLKVVVGF
ncbi:hypothetical protein Tco_1419606 [Tanacetum coccineum]